MAIPFITDLAIIAGVHPLTGKENGPVHPGLLDVSGSFSLRRPVVPA